MLRASADPGNPGHKVEKHHAHIHTKGKIGLCQSTFRKVFGTWMKPDNPEETHGKTGTSKL